MLMSDNYSAHDGDDLESISSSPLRVRGGATKGKGRSVDGGIVAAQPSDVARPHASGRVGAGTANKGENRNQGSSRPIASHNFRQPACTLLEDVESNSSWKDIKQLLEKRATRAHEVTVATATRDSRNLRKMLDPSLTWGIITPIHAKPGYRPGPATGHAESGTQGGPCAGCLTRGIDCIVEVRCGEVLAGPQSRPRQRDLHTRALSIHSVCIACRTFRNSCDVKLTGKRPMGKTVMAGIARVNESARVATSDSASTSSKSSAVRVPTVVETATSTSGAQGRKRSRPTVESVIDSSGSSSDSGRAALCRNEGPATKPTSAVDSPSDSAASKAHADVLRFVEAVRRKMTVDGNLEYGMELAFDKVERDLEVIGRGIRTDVG